MKILIIIAIAFVLLIPVNVFAEYIIEVRKTIPEIILQIIPEPTPEPESPQESEKSSNGEPIIIPDEDKSANNQIIWVFVIISFIIMGFAILKKKSSSN